MSFCLSSCVYLCVFVFIFVRVCAWQLPLRPPRDNMEMFPFAPRDISLSISPLPVSYINVNIARIIIKILDCTPADFLKLRCLWPKLDLDIVLSAPSRFFLLCHSRRDKMAKRTSSILTTLHLLLISLSFVRCVISLLLRPIIIFGIRTQPNQVPVWWG